jgi:PAS domain S-box-containing protein
MENKIIEEIATLVRRLNTNEIGNIPSSSLHLLDQVLEELTNLKDKIAKSNHPDFFGNQLDKSISKSEFDAITNSLQDVIWSTTPDFSKVMFINDSVENIYGITKAAFFENPNLWMDAILEEDKAIAQKANVVLREKSKYDVEYRIKNAKTNEVKWVRVKGYVVFDTNNLPFRIIGISSDITEKKNQQLAIQNQAIELQKVTEILEKTNDLGKIGGWEYNVQNEELKFARYMYELHEEDYMLQPTLDTLNSYYLEGKNRERFITAFNKLRNENKPFDLTLQITTKSGIIKWVRSIGEAEFFRNICIRIHGTVQDITEKKEKEFLKLKNLELERDKEVALQKAEVKEQFLANMSHEIRTPMNAIIGLSNLLHKVGDLNGKQEDYLKTIKLNSKNLLGIINDILDLSKIEANKIELESLPFNLTEHVQQVVKSLHHRAAKKKIALTSNIDPSIPKNVLGDSVRLLQVLNNLTSNAIKFTNKGSVEIRLKKIFEDDTKVGIRFKVVDTGIGIAENRRKEIFEPFTQETNSITRLYGGTGLGLSISKKLVEQFGGNIKVESVVNQGSTFSFELVFLIHNSQEELVEQHSNIESIQKGECTFLLVEDNEFNQMVAIDTLLDWNPNLIVDVAVDGKQAKEMLAKKKYDLILLDIQMPEMDGHELALIIRNELKLTLPIIALTANTNELEKQQCLVEGMNDYVAKPFVANELFKKINKWALKNWTVNIEN